MFINCSPNIIRMNGSKPVKVAVGVSLLGVFGSLVFSSLLVLLPRFMNLTSSYMYADVIGRLVVFADGAWIVIVIPSVSSVLSYIYILKGFNKLSVVTGFTLCGLILSIGNFLVGISIRYITSPTMPENYNLYSMIFIGIIVVCGSIAGILLGMLTDESPKRHSTAN